jgi:TPR repeat protein
MNNRLKELYEDKSLESYEFHDFVLKTYSDYFRSFKIEKYSEKITEKILTEFKKIVYEQFDLLCLKEFNIDELLCLYELIDITLGTEKHKECLYYYIKHTKTAKALEFFAFIDAKEHSYNACVFLIRESKELFREEYFKNSLELLGRLVAKDVVNYDMIVKTNINQDNLGLLGCILRKKKIFKEARKLFKKNWEENKNSPSLNNLAIMIYKGEGGYQNKEEARELYKKNWEENKNSPSLYNLANMIRRGKGGYENKEEARELFKKNWEENKNSFSLYNLASMIYGGEGGYQNKEEARELFKKNWEENKDSDSLHRLTCMIYKGEGGYQNKEEARELYKKNWEENKNSFSLHSLACMILKGIGGYRNQEEARELFKKNWEENRHGVSLYNLASMIYGGEGGYQNREEAEALFALYNSLKTT